MADVSAMPTKKFTELLNMIPDIDEMYVRVHSDNSVALGRNPMEPEIIIDFSKEYSRPVKINLEPPSFFKSGQNNRSTGAYWFEMGGTRSECRSVKELLAAALKAIELRAPGTLEKLSRIKPRTRRIVARKREDLFDQTHLIERFSDRLIDGWWYGTNNSSQETQTWLKRACDLAGLEWGRDFSTNL